MLVISEALNMCTPHANQKQTHLASSQTVLYFMDALTLISRGSGKLRGSQLGRWQASPLFICQRVRVVALMCASLHAKAVHTRLTKILRYACLIALSFAPLYHKQTAHFSDCTLINLIRQTCAGKASKVMRGAARERAGNKKLISWCHIM